MVVPTPWTKLLRHARIDLTINRPKAAPSPRNQQNNISDHDVQIYPQSEPRTSRRKEVPIPDERRCQGGASRAHGGDRADRAVVARIALEGYHADFLRCVFDMATELVLHDTQCTHLSRRGLAMSHNSNIRRIPTRIERGTASDVASLRPSASARSFGAMSPKCSFSNSASKKLYSLLTSLHSVGGYSHTFGALDPIQVVQMAPRESNSESPPHRDRRRDFLNHVVCIPPLICTCRFEQHLYQRMAMLKHRKFDE